MIKSMNSGRMINRIFRAALTAMLIADLAEVISSITDGMLTGHCLGPACMAAYGIVKPFYSITGIISAILSSGALTLSAHYVGKGDARKTNQLFSLTVFLGIALSAALAVILAKLKRKTYEVTRIKHDEAERINRLVVYYMCIDDLPL